MMIPTKNKLNKLNAAAKSIELDLDLKRLLPRPSSVKSASFFSSVPKSPTRSALMRDRSITPPPPRRDRSLTPPPISHRALSPTLSSRARQGDGAALRRIRELEKQNAQLESTVLYHLCTMEATQRESEALHAFVRLLKSSRNNFPQFGDFCQILKKFECHDILETLSRRSLPREEDEVPRVSPRPAENEDKRIQEIMQLIMKNKPVTM
jgi:hypothetical protein